jgi:hypothetical protein
MVALPPCIAHTRKKHHSKISSSKIYTTRRYLPVGFAIPKDIFQWMGGWDMGEILIN